MSKEEYFSFSINEEMAPYFDESSLPKDGQPKIVLLVGAPAVGKTTLRKQRYSSGYVLVDSVPIFLSLCRGQYLDFPGALEEPMNLIGLMVAERAISERRHIVTELVVESAKWLEELVDAMLSIGYGVDLMYVDALFESAVKWNLARDQDCISSFFAGKYQREWLIKAVQQSKAEESRRSTEGG